MQISNSLSNRIADTVQDAISENLTPEDFIQEVRACWKMSLGAKAKDADKVFTDMLKKTPR